MGSTFKNKSSEKLKNIMGDIDNNAIQIIELISPEKALEIINEIMIESPPNLKLSPL